MSGKGSRPLGLARSALRAGNRIGRKVSRHRYSTAKAYYLARLRFAPSKDPILVYTMGKVGSTSISKSLVAGGVDRPIHHLHWLSPKQLAESDAFYRAADRRYRGTGRAQRFRPEFLWLGEHLSRQINRDPARRWQVITLVRDPVARNLSNFFQNADSFWDYWIDDELARKTIEEVAEELVELFPSTIQTNSFPDRRQAEPLTWFTQELRTVFNVDVFAEGFPREKGFYLYQSKRAEVLLMRLEDLDRCAKEALTTFVARGTFQPTRANVSGSKSYAAAYRRFLEIIRLPDDYLHEFYSSEMSRHFYTQAEIEGFRSKWTR